MTTGPTLYGYDLSGHLLEEGAGTAITDYIYLDGRPVAALTTTTGALAFLMTGSAHRSVLPIVVSQPFGRPITNLMA